VTGAYRQQSLRQRDKNETFTSCRFELRRIVANYEIHGPWRIESNTFCRFLRRGFAEGTDGISKSPYGQNIGTAEEPVLHRAIELAGAQSWGDAYQSGFRDFPDLPIASRRIGVPGFEPLGVRSRRLLMVIAQEPTQSLPALNRLRLAADMRITREQQDVTLALVIPLGMIMPDVFVQRPPQGALAQEDHLGQALLLHRPNPALRIGIQVRTAGRQRERFNLT